MCYETMVHPRTQSDEASLLPVAVGYDANFTWPNAGEIKRNSPLYVHYANTLVTSGDKANRSPLPFKRDTPPTRTTPQSAARNERESLHVVHALEGTNFRRLARLRRPLRKLRAAFKMILQLNI